MKSSERACRAAATVDTARCAGRDNLTEFVMPTDYFGEPVAQRYDASTAELSGPEIVDPIVDFLVDLSVNGTALELGIGTGRIALPLAERGIRVHGIDLSEAMVARLRAKPGAEEIGVTIGDFARPPSRAVSRFPT